MCIYRYVNKYEIKIKSKLIKISLMLSRILCNLVYKTALKTVQILFIKISLLRKFTAFKLSC